MEKTIISFMKMDTIGMLKVLMFPIRNLNLILKDFNVMKTGNLHNGTSPVTVQLQYGTPNRKIMYIYAPILRLYRFVAEPHNGTGVIKKIMYTYSRVN